MKKTVPAPGPLWLLDGLSRLRYAEAMDAHSHFVETEIKLTVTVRYTFEADSDWIDVGHMPGCNDHGSSLPDFSVLVGQHDNVRDITAQLPQEVYDSLYLDTLTYAAEQHALGPDPDPAPDEE